MDVVDADGNTVSQANLRSGVDYFVKMTARDSNGRSIPCTPSFTPNNGVSGTQIQGGIDTQANGSGLLHMGSGFGTAEVIGHCQELPNVTAKMEVVNATPLNTPQFPKNGGQTPPETNVGGTGGGALGVSSGETSPPADAGAGTAAGAAAGGAGSGAGALLGIAAGAGVAALAIGLAMKSSNPCSQPSRYCKGPEVCCPSADMYYCTGPSNVKGCYDTVFITGCSEKVFCTSDY